MLPKFIEAFFSSVLARSNHNQNRHERNLRLRLRWIKRLLMRSGTDLYHPRTKMVGISMARLLFSIYKEVWFLQDTLQQAKSSRRLQAIVIWVYLTAEQREFYKALHLKYIVRLAKQQAVPTVIATVNRNLHTFCASFDPLIRRNINSLFCRILDFIKLATFDYYYLLRKFDASMPEHIHSYHPIFRPIEGHNISDLLKDFLEVIRPIATFNEEQLVHVARIFNEYSSAGIITIKRWHKLITSLKKLVHSDILISIIRHIDTNVNYEPPANPMNHKIITDFLNWLRVTTKNNITIALEEKRNTQISQLIGKVFGKEHPERLRHKNRTLIGENLARSIYIEELEYMQQFLRGPFEKVIFDFIQKTFIVQASWRSRPEYSAFTQLIYRLQEISRQMGGYVPTTTTVVLQRPESPDTLALRLLQNGQQTLTETLRMLKSLLDELVSKRNNIIVNWKELVLRADFALPKQLFQSYKRVYYLLELLELLRQYNSDAQDTAA